MHIWADVFHPVVHVEVETKEVTSMRVSYESWRTADRVMSREEGLQCSYVGEWPGTVVTTHDSILVGEENLTFSSKCLAYHCRCCHKAARPGKRGFSFI